MRFIDNTTKSKAAVMLLFLAGAVASSPGRGEIDSPHPITEKELMEERAPLNLDVLELKELLDLKKRHLEEMKSLEAEIDKINEESGRLVAALAAYDEQRLKIAEIMPGLIEHYAIGEPLSSTLIRYTKTLLRIHDDYKNHLGNLGAYKSYDFRMGIAYASMMSQLENFKDVYRRMRADMEDEKTLIGGYQASLKQHYGRIEELIKSEKMSEYYRLKQIEEELRRIDGEIRGRH